MYQAFYDLIYGVLFNNNDVSVLGSISHTFGVGSSSVNISMAQYFSTILASICTITVFVCVCLLIVKVIKLFSRLWSRF